MATSWKEKEIFFRRPPTSDEALAMAEEEYRDIREKYGLAADFRYSWRIFQGAIGDLKSVLPRGRELLQMGLRKLW